VHCLRALLYHSRVELDLALGALESAIEIAAASRRSYL
jgi:hypothetical protein